MSGQALQILGSLGEAPPQGGTGGSGGGAGATGGEGGGESASQSAGQDTAAGSGNAGIAGAMGDFAGGLDNNQTLASQAAAVAGIVDGLSTWEQVTTAFTGQGYYVGVGDYVCTGGSCGSGTTVTNGLDFSAYVDFAARQITSGSVVVAAFPSVGPPWDSVTIVSPIPFGTSGNAVISLCDPGPCGVNGGNFYGTTANFMNRGGAAAADMKVDLKYTTSFSGSGYQATGSTTGSFTPGGG